MGEEEDAPAAAPVLIALPSYLRSRRFSGAAATAKGVTAASESANPSAAVVFATNAGTPPSGIDHRAAPLRTERAVSA